MIHIRLFTIQPYPVWEILQKTGRYVCNIKLTKHRDYDEFSFRDVYDWLASQMAERIGQPPDDVKYPIWAWYRNDDDFSAWGNAGQKYAIITLDISPYRVVLSDHDAWNSVIGHCPVIYEDDHVKWDAEWERYMRMGKNAIYGTWPRIFRASSAYVQATFWELFLDDVVSVESFISTGFIPDTALG